VKRGDLFWADLAPRSGSEQSGRRPVIVISHDSLNQTASWRSVIVVPISTSQRQGRRGLTAIALQAGSAALTRDSVALCHQVTTVDKSKLSQFIGALPASALREVEEGLRVALDLE
jgi:mRNA interferase MazF